MHLSMIRQLRIGLTDRIMLTKCNICSVGRYISTYSVLCLEQRLVLNYHYIEIVVTRIVLLEPLHADLLISYNIQHEQIVFRRNKNVPTQTN